MRDLLLTAPRDLRARLNAKTLEGKAIQARSLRPNRKVIHEPEHAVKYALRDLGRRVHELTSQINDIDKHLLITADENFNRFRNGAAFARLCGLAPIPVSSGKTNRMRLHRKGNSQAKRNDSN